MDAMGEIAAGDPLQGRRLTDEQRDALVVEMVRLHADGLLRLARRHSLCADDAQDAYQRGLEIFLRHAPRLDPERAPSWLRTVVKHEAMAVRRSRQRDMAPGDLDFDGLEARTSPSPDEQVAAFETVTRSAEALQRLKPQEVRALWLRAQGNSYEEIRELTGWSRTKVNRCLYEGRRSFLERYAGIASGAECERWQPLLSRLVDGEATREELLDLRPHLRACPACRGAVRELHRAATPLAIVFPVGAAAEAHASLEPAGHLFVKVYETATTWLGERAASSFVRAQIAVDALSASAGKVTAVAAASAAVAGGGAVVVDHAARQAPPRPVVGVVPLGRSAEPADAGGSQRRLTVEEQVNRRVATLRRRLERRAAAARRRSAGAAATRAQSAAATRAQSAAAVQSAAPAARVLPRSSAPGLTPAPGTPAPPPASTGAAAELGLE